MTGDSSKAVDIKGNMFTLMSIVLHTADLARIESGIIERVKQAPEFFRHTPVIIDFSRIAADAGFEFKQLFKLVRQSEMLPVAVRGIPDELREQLQAAGVPIVEQAAANTDDEETPSISQLSELAPTKAQTMIVEKPVRSGQQCYAKDGDLVVLAQSNAAAELIASGNIHVYGVLRGRALCGVDGDTSARIFCSSLEAELVSVAGHYKVLEDIPAAVKDRPVQIRLSNEKLMIDPL